MNRLAMLSGLPFAGTARARTPGKLRKYPSTDAHTFEAHVVAKFAKYDLVLIGEPHWIRQRVALVSNFLPELHPRGVNILAIACARRIDQAPIDSVWCAHEEQMK